MLQVFVIVGVKVGVGELVYVIDHVFVIVGVKVGVGELVYVIDRV